jgi:hypothetical protein
MHKQTPYSEKKAKMTEPKPDSPELAALRDDMEFHQKVAFLFSQASFSFNLANLPAAMPEIQKAEAYLKRAIASAGEAEKAFAELLKVEKPETQSDKVEYAGPVAVKDLDTLKPKEVNGETH